MRPRSLALKGFTCFRRATAIDFEDMRVFAIVGRTGSGKTTIMDAICYALYGRVPRGTDAGRLVSRGADKMAVSFEFDAAGGRYRATRSTNVSAKGKQTSHVLLERHLTSDEWEPLEDRARPMNDHVEHVIGLDFKAFERCVLLPQGRFQEMLTGDPQERRRVLEELLDIGIYEQIMRRANTVKTQLTADANAIEKVLSEHADATEEALSATQEQLASRKPELKTAQHRRDALNAALDHANALRQARDDERTDNQTLGEHRKQIEEADGLAREGQSVLDELTSLLDKTRAALQELGYDRELHMALAGALDAARSAETARARAAGAAQAATDRTALDVAIAGAKSAAEALAHAKAARGQAETAAEDAQRADAAAHLRAGLKAGDPCPVCGGTVGKIRAAAPAALRKAQDALTKAQREEAKAGEHAIQAQRAADRAQADHDRAQADAAAAARAVEEAEMLLKQRAPKGIAPAAGTIERKLKELATRGRESDRLSEELTKVAERRSNHERAMAQARDALTALKGAAQQLEGRIATSRKRGDEAITSLRAIVDRWKWGDIADLLEQRKDPRSKLDEMRHDANEECTSLAGLIGTLEERAKRIAAQIEEANQRRTELEGIRKRAGLYGLIGDLLQANHFRDWYISTAMAMLAEAASRRLEVLDGDRRYALGVANGEFTVIDAWEGGEVRSPDTLSGGETFVVSLALALALAEQLPQIQASAGAALESLFLDEGFGTLDADTLDPVVNAIQGLGAEGRTVGIITHVGELAERVGTRIEVTKSPEGSSVTVVGA